MAKQIKVIRILVFENRKNYLKVTFLHDFDSFKNHF